MKKILQLALTLSFVTGFLYAEEVETISVQELFSAMKNAYDESKWKDVEKKSRQLLEEYPLTTFAKETLFYLGVSFFEQQDYEFANHYFSKYLKGQSSPQYFEETMRYKFAIAKMYSKGAKKHMLGFKAMPKIVPATDDALKIFDEVILTLPHHDLAVAALFKKANIHFHDHSYKEASDAYQTLIRRFPQHRLAIESYLSIARLHLRQCRDECSDPAFLDLAQINLKKFEMAFPGEERLKDAENMLLQMKEKYAFDLFKTGRFYEKAKKSQAATIYYAAAINKFPETKAARQSEQRLEELKKISNEK